MKQLDRLLLSFGLALTSSQGATTEIAQPRGKPDPGTTASGRAESSQGASVV